MKKENKVREIDMNLVNLFLNDIVLYNDVENDFPDELFWRRDRNLIKSLEEDARVMLKKAIMVSESHQKVRVAVVGNFSAGKSTFINSLIQDDICPVADKSTTSSITTFNFAHHKAFYLIDDVGYKKEISAKDYEVMVQHGTEKTLRRGAQFFVEGPWSFVRDISLLDTPGFQRGDDVCNGNIGGDDVVTEEVITKEADVLFWLMDIDIGTITKDQKERIIKLKRETKNSVDIYVILNKADRKGSTGRQKILNDIKKDLGHLIKDVILYSSKKEETIDEVIDLVKISVNNQSLSYQDNWELKFTSSLGRRGGLKFHFHENDNQLHFFHNVDQDNEIGKISERFEVQEMLKEFGTNNNEISNKSFEREFAAYQKRKENITHISNKIKKQMDELWYSNFEPKLASFNEEQKAISKTFINNNIGVFSNMNCEKDHHEILDSFMKLYSSTFKIFRKIVKEKFNYSLNEKVIELFYVKDFFSQQLLVFNDVEKAMNKTTFFLNTNIYSAFYEYILLDYKNLYQKYNNIYTKILR